MAHGNWGKNTICELTLIGATLGQRIVTVHHFEATAVFEGTFGAGDAVRLVAQSDLADAWNTTMKTAYLAMMPSAYSISMIKSQVVEVPGQRNHRLTPTEKTAGVAGGGTGGAAPVDDTSGAAVLKWRSPVAGKSHRGRSYIGPLQGTWVEAGQLSSAGQTAIAAYGTALQAWFVSTPTPVHPWNLTVYSKPYDQGEYGYVRGHGADRVFYFPPDYDGDSTNIVTFSVDPIMRSQRRRQIGVGV